MQTLLSKLPKKLQTITISVAVMLSFMLFIANHLQNSAIQNKVNYRLLSGKEFDLNTLLPSAKMICVVPPKNRIYHEGEVRQYLNNNKVIQLNKKLNSMWWIFINEWHLVGISNNHYEYYRMGGTIMPEYVGTKCLSIQEHSKVSITLTDIGSREFYIVQSGRSPFKFLNKP